MKSWAIFVATFALLGGILLFVASPISTPTAAQDTDDDRDDISTLQTQVAELQTQVATLQTQVAAIQPASTPTEGTPEGIAAACGRPFRSWGGATADDVEVQLLQVSEVDGLPSAQSAIAIELVITNGSDAPVAYRLADFEVADCSGKVSVAVTGGPDPAIADGKIAPGDSLRGWVAFPLAAGAQPADFTYHIQSQDRTGATVSCPLVNRDAPPAALDEATGGAGCSAAGGSA
jgi:hypothetical protein